MKQRAQGAAALLNNWSQAEAALATANNSEGSALEENQKFLDSIQGKLQQLKAAFENLWSGAVDSNVLGFFVDLGTSILKIVDNVGALQVALGAIGAVMAFKGAGRANLNSRPHLKMPAINQIVA